MARLNSRLANRRPVGRWPSRPAATRWPPSVGERGRHPGHLSRPVGTVGVGEHDQLTLASSTPVHAKALAMVGLAADDPNPVVPRRDGAGDSEGLIGRPVIHDQDLHRTGFPDSSAR